MAEPAKRMATYEDLYSIPENITGEIIGGELTVTPRPSRHHVSAASSLGYEIGPAYQFGCGGPGGRIILIEPEIKLGEDILVPDRAGWRKERFPRSEETHWISAHPDWICEILSPGTFRVDKVQKMSIYARHEVQYLWLIDPLNRTMEVFKLVSGRWMVLGVYAEADKARAKPFEEIEIELAFLWLD